jgi:sterol 3beta-glucosyltransferase
MVHTAARAGVPQIVIPQVMDQFYWVKQLYSLGLSPRPIPRAKLTAQRLTNAIQTVLRKPEFKLNAANIKAKLVEKDGLKEVVSYLGKLAI